VWMSEAVADSFRRRAPDLAASPLIEVVSTLYSKDGNEIAAVTFAGNDRDSLSESMSVILSFFQQAALEQQS
jgi:hypothetical protein